LQDRKKNFRRRLFIQLAPSDQVVVGVLLMPLQFLPLRTWEWSTRPRSESEHLRFYRTLHHKSGMQNFFPSFCVNSELAFCTLRPLSCGFSHEPGSANLKKGPFPYIDASRRSWLLTANPDPAPAALGL